MKYFLLPLFLLACINSSGQDSVKRQIKYTQTRYERRVFNESSIVKDSLGNRLSYNIWKPKYESGDFTLSKKEISDSVYTLKWLSAEAKKMQHDKAGPPRMSPYFSNGEKIRPFVTKDIYGNKIDLEKFHDKVVVINFFTTEECGSCKREMISLNEIVNDLSKDQQVVVLSVTCSPKAVTVEFIKNLGIQLSPVISDEDRKITGLYGIKTFPVNVVIDGNGIVRYHSIGASPKNVDYIKQTIEAIIKEKGAGF